MDCESLFSIYVFSTSMNLRSELLEIMLRQMGIDTLFAFILVGPFEKVR